MSRRYLIAPIVGVVVFLLVFAGWPLFASEADIVARASTLVLDASNRYFDSMPPLLATWVAQANLLWVAVTAGLLSMIAAALLLLAYGLLATVCSRLAGWLRRAPAEPVSEDLPPIEMRSTFVSSGDGKEVLGRGLDKLERD